MSTRTSPLLFGLERRHWLVLVAAALGWGFDVFDALLFNYVAPNCIPTLLGLEIGSPAARAATVHWNGVLTALLLIGWAAGGVIFGQLADRVGRTRALRLTIVVYAVGTAACAFAPNLGALILFRALASLGIGGEWAAGATLVAEALPEDKRVTAAAFMQTASPCGLFLAMFVNYLVAGVWFVDEPSISWRYVFLCGLLPVLAVFILRIAALEPGRRAAGPSLQAAGRLKELFSPAQRGATLSGCALAVVALITWWSFNAFLPAIASGLAFEHAGARGLTGTVVAVLAERWKLQATLAFNLGGLIGAVLTAPIAQRFGRRSVFAAYFCVAGLGILASYGLHLEPLTVLRASFVVGLAAFGIFGAFVFYLPELFPAHLRATGAGFTYNTGRVLAAGGPFLVGWVAGQGPNATRSAMGLVSYVGLVPLLALALIPFIPETRGRRLEV